MDTRTHKIPSSRAPVGAKNPYLSLLSYADSERVLQGEVSRMEQLLRTWGNQGRRVEGIHERAYEHE